MRKLAYIGLATSMLIFAGCASMAGSADSAGGMPMGSSVGAGSAANWSYSPLYLGQ